MASELETLTAIEHNGDLNPIQRTRLQELRSAGNDPGSPDGVYSPGQFFGGGAAGGQGAFNFDYAGQTQQSYDELVPYYQHLLDTYKGNMNKVLARLTQDYETGTRNETQTTQQNRETQNEATTNNALARGLYQRSAFDNPVAQNGTVGQRETQGFGIPTQTFNKQNTLLDQGLQKYIESATQTKTRGQEDQAQALTNEQDTREQQHRTEAADLTNQKAQSAYNKYATSPTLA